MIRVSGTCEPDEKNDKEKSEFQWKNIFSLPSSSLFCPLNKFSKINYCWASIVVVFFVRVALDTIGLNGDHKRSNGIRVASSLLICQWKCLLHLLNWNIIILSSIAKNRWKAIRHLTWSNNQMASSATTLCFWFLSASVALELEFARTKTFAMCNCTNRKRVHGARREQAVAQSPRDS